MKNKTKITKVEYWQLTGLLAMAAYHKKAIDEIEKAMRQLTGEEEGVTGGHCGDAIWEEYSADALLKKLEIEVGE